MFKIGSLPADKVLHLISDQGGTKADLLMTPEGCKDSIVLVRVGVSSLRLRCFKRSPVCVKCGRIGNVFVAEKSVENDVSPHLNLYAKLPDGSMVLMTHDHIIPKSRGGANHISNAQTMCAPCNHKKSDDMPQDSQSKLKEYVQKLFEQGKSDRAILDIIQESNAAAGAIGFKPKLTDIVGLLRTFMDTGYRIVSSSKFEELDDQGREVAVVQMEADQKRLDKFGTVEDMWGTYDDGGFISRD